MLLQTRVLTRLLSSPWLDSLILPAYAAGLSVLMILAQFMSSAIRHQRLPADDTSNLLPQTISRRRSFVARSVDNLGGRTIFAFKFAQLLSILGLLGISLAQLVLQHRDTTSRDFFGSTQIVQVVQCVLYVSGSRSMNTMRTKELYRRILLRLPRLLSSGKLQ